LFKKIKKLVKLKMV